MSGTVVPINDETPEPVLEQNIASTVPEGGATSAGKPGDSPKPTTTPSSAISPKSSPVPSSPTRSPTSPNKKGEKILRKTKDETPEQRKLRKEQEARISQRRGSRRKSSSAVTPASPSEVTKPKVYSPEERAELTKKYEKFCRSIFFSRWGFVHDDIREEVEELRRFVPCERECHARQGGALCKHPIAQLREICTSLEIEAEEGFTPIEGSLYSIVPIKIHIPNDCDIRVPDDECDGSFTK